MSNSVVRGQVPYDLSFVNVTDTLEHIGSATAFGERNVVLFGLPGAFTPTCSTQQLPGYEELYAQFSEAGVDEIYCTSVNDGFTMKAWFDSLGIEKVKALSDGNGKFARFMGMLVSKENLGFGNRSWRYAAVIRNGEVVKLFEEEGIRDNREDDPYEASTPQNVLEYVQEHPMTPIPITEHDVEKEGEAPTPAGS